MKGLLYMSLIMFAIVVSSCGRTGNSGRFQEAYENDTIIKLTSVKFDALTLDLGKVEEGEQVVTKFVFMNTGKENLLLQNVSASCGCTKPKFDASPISPGRKSEIEVTFDTRGRSGRQRNSVMVATNTKPPNTVLTFTCEVIPR